MAAQQQAARPSALELHALKYVAAGFRVFPLHNITQSGACSCGADPCGQKPGKHPREGGWAKDNLASTPEAVHAFWQRYPSANIAIKTGYESGLIVLDIDPDKGGNASLEALQQELGPLPDTLTQITGGNGLHLFYRHPGPAFRVKTVAEWRKMPGLDIRGDKNGYVVAAPSMHASGKAYKWDKRKPGAAVELPDTWLEALIEQPEAAPDMAQMRLQAATPDLISRIVDKYVRQASAGRRNDTGMQLACQLRDNGADYLTAESAMSAYQSAVTSEADPYTWGEALKTLRGVYNTAARQPWSTQTSPVTQINQATPRKSYHYTHDGLAMRLVDTYGDTIRFVKKWKRWLVWTGKRWEDDEGGELILLVKRCIKDIFTEASSLLLSDEDTDRERGKKLAGFAMACENASFIISAIKLAAPHVMIDPNELDSDQWILNCMNGILDLKTGQLMPHDRTRYCTKIASVAFDPEAQAPTWLTFLDWFTCQRADMVAWLQRAVGYTLTGSTAEQSMLLLYGNGGNGKNTLVDILLDLLGDYGTQTPTKTLMKRENDNSINNDVARLHGMRLVAASESDDGERLNEGLVKSMTGDRFMTARFLHAEFFTFTPRFKIWFSTNNRPIIRDTGESMARRLRMVPCDAAITTKDGNLPAKLQAELPGILAWAVRGCQEWLKQGLETPETVKSATADYLEEMDTFSHFIGDCCIQGAQYIATGKQLWNAYQGWCDANNERPMQSRSFGLQLGKRGFKKEHSRNGVIWQGLGVSTSNNPGPRPTQTVNRDPCDSCDPLPGFFPLESSHENYLDIESQESQGSHKEDIGGKEKAKQGALLAADVPEIAKKPRGKCIECRRSDKYTYSESANDWLCNACHRPYWQVFNDRMVNPLG